MRLYQGNVKDAVGVCMPLPEKEDGYAVLLVMKYELMLKNLLERLGYIRSDNQADGNDVYIRAAKCSD